MPVHLGQLACGKAKNDVEVVLDLEPAEPAGSELPTLHQQRVVGELLELLHLDPIVAKLPEEAAQVCADLLGAARLMRAVGVKTGAPLGSNEAGPVPG